MGEARRRFAVARFESDALDRLTRADEHFFARTGRRHRLRLAGRAEVEALRSAYGTDAVWLDGGARLFAIVKVAFDGGHLKAFTVNRADADVDVDVPEEFAAGLYDHLTSRDPGMAFLEHTMRRLAGEVPR